MHLPVTKIQKFCTKDGPGVRTTVFLKGCPLRCIWCHNPETRSALAEYFYTPKFCIMCGACANVCPKGVHTFQENSHTVLRSKCLRCMRCAEACPTGALERCAKMMQPEEILKEVLKDKAFYGQKGGLTLSGGEPTVHGQAIVPLLQGAKDNGIGTAIETCGYFDAALLPKLIPVTDLFLWDLKDTCPKRHLANTGSSLEKILSNLYKADSLGAVTRLRCILLKGVNLNEQHLNAVAGIFGNLKHCTGIELLPYHTYGDSKLIQLGHSSQANTDWIPTAEDMQFAANIIRTRAVLIEN